MNGNDLIEPFAVWVQRGSINLGRYVGIAPDHWVYNNRAEACGYAAEFDSFLRRPAASCGRNCAATRAAAGMTGAHRLVLDRAQRVSRQ